MHLLSTLIFLPMLGALGIFLYGQRPKANPCAIRWMALSTVLLTLILSLFLYSGYDPNTAAMQFRETASWIPMHHIQYDVGVDGISVLLITLTAFANLLVVLHAWKGVPNHHAYFSAFLVLQSMVTGVFCALDAVLFYVFWEGMLIPMYLAMGFWGGAQRGKAAIKFFLYTFLGSALLLVGIVYLGLKSGNFSILSFYPLKLNLTEQVLLFVGFLMAFAIKVPMWPVHTWLPDAHTQAPTGGSVILAALLLKVGAYGFLRFNLPMLPDASLLLSPMMVVLSLVAIVYIGLVALSQDDMKRLIAYSSVAHMGFVTLGFFIIYAIVARTHQPDLALLPMEGAIIQMFAHGFSAAALFLGFGMLYERFHTRLIQDFGGIAQVMPGLSAFFILFCFSNIGLPGTSGFVGEFMVIMGTFHASGWIAGCAALTLIISACYTLWMYQRVFQGEQRLHTHPEPMTQMERFICLLLTACIFGLGIYPQPVISVLHTTTPHLLTMATQSKLNPAIR